MADLLGYRCPRCRGELEKVPAELPEGYRCRACGGTYPVVCGIPDFRLFADPWLDLEADRERARWLAERAPEVGFEGLLELYWTRAEPTPPAMVRRFTAHARGGLERGRHLLERLEEEGVTAAGAGTPALELGCRSGGLLAAVAERRPAVGIDLALRWLVIARRRLEELGLEARLCCCCAEHLPFADDGFGLLLAEGLLEHAAGRERIVAEAHRALRPGGVFYLSTWNRLSLAPEPHVRLFGVGYLPPRLAAAYVRRRRGVSYRARLLSGRELARLLAASPFGGGRISPLRFAPAEVARLPRPWRALSAVYHRLAKPPISRALMRLAAPVLEAVCVRRAPVEPGGDRGKLR